MVTNYYNASNNFSAPIRREPKPFSPEREPFDITPEHHAPKPEPPRPTSETLEVLERNTPNCERQTFLDFDSDTIVLLALLWLLFTSKSNDRLLELALIYLLL